MPFSTHEGSELAGIVRDIRKYTPNADTKPGLAIVGSQINSFKDKLER